MLPRTPFRANFHMTDDPACLSGAFTIAELGEMLPWISDLHEETAFLETTKNGPQCTVAKTYSICYSPGGDLDDNQPTDVFSENT
jgi:hypothetical protein